MSLPATIPFHNIIPSGVTIVECHDFRFASFGPPMPVIRVIFKNGFQYLLTTMNLDNRNFSVSEVRPNPPLEWYPLTRNEDISESEARRLFLEWANRS